MISTDPFKPSQWALQNFSFSGGIQEQAGLPHFFASLMGSPIFVLSCLLLRVAPKLGCGDWHSRAKFWIGPSPTEKMGLNVGTLLRLVLLSLVGLLGKP